MPYSFSNILRSTSRYSPSTVIRCFYSFRMSRTVRSFFLIRCICAILLRHRRNRNLLQSAPHSGPAESSGICHAPISITAVSAFSGLLGLRISDDLPHQPCQRASADSTADGGAGNRCADRLFRSESLYRHVPQKHRTDTVRVSENQIMLCAAACFISVH